MKTSDSAYVRFSRILLAGAVLPDPAVGFPELCRWAGADPRALDSLLREELGLGGEALLAAFRAREAGKSDKSDLL